MKIIQSLLLKNIIISKTCKSSKLDLFPLQFTLTIKMQHCTFPGKPKRKPQYVLFPLVFFKKKSCGHFASRQCSAKSAYKWNCLLSIPLTWNWIKGPQFQFLILLTSSWTAKFRLTAKSSFSAGWIGIFGKRIMHFLSAPSVFRKWQKGFGCSVSRTIKQKTSTSSHTHLTHLRAAFKAKTTRRGAIMPPCS